MLHRLSIVVLFAIALMGPSAVCASDGSRITTAQAAAYAQERFDGQVIDVELEDADDDYEPARDVYEVKLLTRDNMIIKVRFDATTGAFLQAKGDNLIPAIRRPKGPS